MSPHGLAPASESPYAWLLHTLSRPDKILSLQCDGMLPLHIKRVNEHPDHTYRQALRTSVGDSLLDTNSLGIKWLAKCHLKHPAKQGRRSGLSTACAGQRKTAPH